MNKKPASSVNFSSVHVGILLLVVLSLLGSVKPLRAQDSEGPMSELRFVVVRDYNGKPVRNAAVVLHPVSRKGRQARGGLELKTDNEGRTNIDGIPYGPLRVQVLAPGFQTFGEDYDINKPQLEITVNLKRPGDQYSIYDKPADAKKAADNKAEDKKIEDKKPEDKKPESKTSKAEDKTTEDKKTEDKATEDKTIDDQKPADPPKPQQ